MIPLTYDWHTILLVTDKHIFREKIVFNNIFVIHLLVFPQLTNKYLK